MSAFKRATKEKLLLRVCLCGVSGSGKTLTALKIAEALGRPVRGIDSERGSMRKYADKVAPFEVLELESDQSAAAYVAAIDEASYDGFRGTLVIDSLSHAWIGKGGALEQVDRIASQSRSGNSFTAWREVTPMHNKLVDALLAFPGHVIVTLRVKTEYILEEGARGTKIPRKIGTQPVMRDGIEYEFDVCGDMDLENKLMISKTRCSALAGQSFVRPGKDIGRILLAWAEDGVEREVAAAPAQAAPAAVAAPPEPAAKHQAPAPAPSEMTNEEWEAWESMRAAWAECEYNQVSLGPLKSLYKRAQEAITKPSPAYIALVSSTAKRAQEAIKARIAAAKSPEEGTAPPAEDGNEAWGFGGSTKEGGR